VTEPLTPEPLPQVLQRLRATPLTARGLDTVHRRADGIRRARRRTTVAATAGAVAGIVGLAQLLVPGTSSAPAPRPTATGRPVPATTPPAGRSPDGLLYPADLGTGWWENGSQTTNGDLQVGCTGFTPAAGLGHVRFFDATTPVGGALTVQETVVTLDAATTRQVAAELAGPSRTGCTTLRGRDVVLAASEQVLVVSGRITPAGSVGSATAYALVGSTWVTLQAELRSLGTGTGEPLPLPGQADWVLQVTGTAIERATGTRLRLPEPNAAARAAAAKYVTPSPMPSLASPSGGSAVTAGSTASDADRPTGTAAPSPTGATATGPTGATATAPAGFLTPADLGPGGPWSVGTRSGDRSGPGPRTIQLPGSSLSHVPARAVAGSGSTQTYRGRPTGGSTAGSGSDWLLTEEVLRIDRSHLAEDAGDFARLLADSGPFTGTTAGTLAFVWSDGSGFVAARPGPRTGTFEAISGWVLRDDLLVHLDGRPGGTGAGGSGGAVVQADPQWFIGLLDQAARRAAG